MSLYTKEQRVWCKSHDSLAIIREARYVTVGGKRKAEYVICLVESVRRRIGSSMLHPPRPLPDFMTGSKDLRAADYCCDGCSRYLPGAPHISGPDGEYENGLHFCFLCSGQTNADYRRMERLGWEG